MNENKKIKFTLGIILLILFVLWYNIILKSWLINSGISQKFQDLISKLITLTLAYIAIINNELNQCIRNNLKTIYSSLTIRDLIGLSLSIILFIYLGMKSYGVKFKNLYKEYFPYEN